MAREDHWRWVSTPRWARASSKVVSRHQRKINHAKIWRGMAVGRVQKKDCSSNLPSGSRTTTQRKATGAMPIRYHSAVPDKYSIVRGRPSYHGRVKVVQ